MLTSDEVVSYADLAGRVAAVAERLGTERRLVLIAGSNRLDSVVGYLAALSAGHPAILVPGDNPGNLSSLTAAYDPDIVIGGGEVDVRREVSAHDLHPSLALLLSTSGSTGSPKLVRLSHENLQANAESIASYLEIRSTDRAATTLPMHYCYGLSVINSHLLRGAGLILTDLSVVDACFWDLFRSHRGTTFAGVPYTFDLLDRIGFERMHLPDLRYLTQAGGRLPADRVRRYAAMGQRQGWDLFVMYGQTEATARMAYLPPDLAMSEPSSIGLPIPGGSFTLAPLPERPLDGNTVVETGELVYTGDNVMLGYATTPADLAKGREVSELRTGDIARRTPAGLYEIVGRRNRFAKVFGLRIDLDQVERVFAAAGVPAFCADRDESLVVVTESEVEAAALERVAKQHFGLPPTALRIAVGAEVPRLPTGKPDYRLITTQVPETLRAEEAPATDLRTLYAELLNRPDATDEDTFVTLEGDSLSYVEMSIRLEQALGQLPVNWHVTPIKDLAAADVGPGRRRWRGWRSLETNVVLRAVAIVLIVGSHGNLFMIAGGAHVLLAVAGFNFGRFHLTSAPRTERVRHLATSVARIAVPSVLWIGLVALFSRDQTVVQALLLNGVLGPDGWAEPQWFYWFIEALVYTLAALTIVMAVPLVDRLERRWSFWLPVAMVAAGLLTRFEVVSLADGDRIHRAHVIFWLFALGWATAKATSIRQRLLVSVLTLVSLPGFFEDAFREGVVMAGVLALVWLPRVRVPAFAGRALAVLASASLYIYLSHWQVYPYLEDSYPLLAVLSSLTVGIVLWQVATRVAPPGRFARRLDPRRR